MKIILLLLLLTSFTFIACNSNSRETPEELQRKRIEETMDKIDSIKQIQIEPVERKEYEITIPKEEKN
ncbi:MAG: hypothetical protein DCO96_07285 [Fluviicola sp. XM-24bin1]|nr:MAG: hypothetical protein DCO96_07285 [Fluviicola sp. XM-24bin1]